MSARQLAAALSTAGLLLIVAHYVVNSAERRHGGASSTNYAEASSLRRRLFGDSAAAAAPQQQPSKLPAPFLVKQDAGSSLPPQRVENRIINGKRASPDDFAFMVALLLNNQLICGGTLLDATTVLTAAHCVVDTGLVNDPSGLTVYTVNGSQIPVEAAYAHPEYDPSKIPGDNFDQMFEGNLYDVAVLKLEEPVPDPVTVTLADSSTTLERGETLQVAGFGKTETGQASSFLEYAEVDFNAAGRCPLEEYKDVLCAGGTGQNTCNGDSGGPLLIRDPDTGDAVQIGITSHGPDCPSGPADAYGYYTDVREYRDVVAALQAENFTALPPMPSPQPGAPGGIGGGIVGGGGIGGGGGGGGDGPVGGVPGAGSGGPAGSGSDTCLGSLSRYGAGVALEGGDLSRGSFIVALSPEECCRICSVVSSCWAWTWSSAADRICGGPCCVLKQLSGYSPVYAPDAISGAWYPQNWTEPS